MTSRTRPQGAFTLLATTALSFAALSAESPARADAPVIVMPDEIEWRSVGEAGVVISGVFHFAFGDSWDEAALEPYVPGTVWSEPPGAHHFAWAKEGEVVALLTAIGPTGSTPAAPAR